MQTKEWYDLCVQTGISDFFFKSSNKDRRNKAPTWMNDIEKEYWKGGVLLAKKLSNTNRAK